MQPLTASHNATGGIGSTGLFVPSNIYSCMHMHVCIHVQRCTEVTPIRTLVMHPVLHLILHPILHPIPYSVQSTLVVSSTEHSAITHPNDNHSRYPRQQPPESLLHAHPSLSHDSPSVSASDSRPPSHNHHHLFQSSPRPLGTLGRLLHSCRHISNFPGPSTHPP